MMEVIEFENAKYYESTSLPSSFVMNNAHFVTEIEAAFLWGEGDGMRSPCESAYTKNIRIEGDLVFTRNGDNGWIVEKNEERYHLSSDNISLFNNVHGFSSCGCQACSEVVLFFHIEQFCLYGLDFYGRILCGCDICEEERMNLFPPSPISQKYQKINEENALIAAQKKAAQEKKEQEEKNALIQSQSKDICSWIDAWIATYLNGFNAKGWQWASANDTGYVLYISSSEKKASLVVVKKVDQYHWNNYEVTLKKGTKEWNECHSRKLNADSGYISNIESDVAKYISSRYPNITIFMERK